MNNDITKLKFFGATNVTVNGRELELAVDAEVVNDCENLAELLKESIVYSCCNDEMSYEDSLICPTCKENF